MMADVSSATPLVAVIEHCLCGSTCVRQDPIRNAFKLMTEENILGAPVTTANGRFYGTREVVDFELLALNTVVLWAGAGFVDVMDVVTFTLRMFPKDSDINKESLSEFFAKEGK